MRMSNKKTKMKINNKITIKMNNKNSNNKMV
jgi:hypothetical protein